MKITKTQLKQIIKEELDDLTEALPFSTIMYLSRRRRDPPDPWYPPLSSYEDYEEEPEESEPKPKPSAEPEPEPEWRRRQREEAEAKALADERSQRIGAEKERSRARRKAQKRVDMGAETDEDRTLIGLQEAILQKVLEKFK